MRLFFNESEILDIKNDKNNIEIIFEDVFCDEKKIKTKIEVNCVTEILVSELDISTMQHNDFKIDKIEKAAPDNVIICVGFNDIDYTDPDEAFDLDDLEYKKIEKVFTYEGSSYIDLDGKEFIIVIEWMDYAAKKDFTCSYAIKAAKMSITLL